MVLLSASDTFKKVHEVCIVLISYVDLNGVQDIALKFYIYSYKWGFLTVLSVVTYIYDIIEIMLAFIFISLISYWNCWPDVKQFYICGQVCITLHLHVSSEDYSQSFFTSYIMPLV